MIGNINVKELMDAAKEKEKERDKEREKNFHEYLNNVGKQGTVYIAKLDDLAREQLEKEKDLAIEKEKAEAAKKAEEEILKKYGRSDLDKAWKDFSKAVSERIEQDRKEY